MIGPVPLQVVACGRLLVTVRSLGKDLRYSGREARFEDAVIRSHFKA